MTCLFQFGKFHLSFLEARKSQNLLRLPPCYAHKYVSSHAMPWAPITLHHSTSACVLNVICHVICNMRLLACNETIKIRQSREVTVHSKYERL